MSLASALSRGYLALLVAGVVACSVVGAARWHRALASVAASAEALPDRLAEGFDSQMGFGQLKADALAVRAAAGEALVACGATAQACVDGRLPSPSGLCAANTTAERLRIRQELAGSLSAVQRVATDQYLGTHDLAETAASLSSIAQQQGRLEDATAESFCIVFESADRLARGAHDARAAVLRISTGVAQSQVVRAMSGRGGALAVLHPLPYFALASAIVLARLWEKSGAKCLVNSAPGSRRSPHPHPALLCMCCGLYFVLLAAEWACDLGQGRILRDLPLKGHPTFGELLGHLESTFPRFWEVALAPTEGSINELYAARDLNLAAFLSVLTVYFCIVNERRAGTGEVTAGYLPHDTASLPQPTPVAS